jgi:hypothetical protein
MVVVGLVLLGGLGVWRLADVFPSNRERVVALVTYVAMPLLPGVMSTGRLSALVAYAAVPWFVNALRLVVGIGTADPRTMDSDLADGVLDLGRRERVRRTAVATLVAAVAGAMAPPVLLILAAVAVVLGVTSLLAGAPWRTGAWFAGAGLVACVVGWLLNLPAAAAWSWDGLTATPLAGPYGRGLTAVLVMDIGDARLSVLALAFYVPVVTGLLLARAWRLTWAARSAGLVVVFVTLAVLQDRDALPVRVPDIGMLLVPVALGLSLAAACAVSSFSSDVAGGSFGWRQPLGVLSMAAVLVAMFPALVTLTDGAWFAPDDSIAELAGRQLPPDPAVGEFRVLYLGDPRLMPVASQELAPGIAMGLTGPGVADTRYHWEPPDTDGDAALRAALDEIASNSTQRGGRLLAPFGIRYIVVPLFDGSQSTPSDPIEPPGGLLGALASQLDLGLQYSPSNFVLYSNRSAFATAAVFTGASATAAAATTPAEIVQTDLSAATPAFPGVPISARDATSDIAAGTVHLAVPFDENWRLDVGGQSVAAAEGFGVMTAYAAPAAGTAELKYSSPSSRTWALLAQALAWLAVLLLASRIQIPARVRSLAGRPARTVGGDGPIDLEADEIAWPTEAGDVPVIEPDDASYSAPDEAGWVDELLDNDASPRDGTLR